MGTITPRKRKDGSTGYLARVRLKQAGAVIHAETQTFDRQQAAKAWIQKRETELAVPGALDRLKADDPSVAHLIGQYIAESQRDIGRTKTQVLQTIQNSDFAQHQCSQVDSAAVVQWLQTLNCQPATRQNYLSHLSAVVALAQPVWRYPISSSVMQEARVAAERLGLIGKSRQRERRPTLDELDRLLTYFTDYEYRRARSPGKRPLPMVDLVVFALFSSRRQEEIASLTWEDFNDKLGQIIVRDMKHPGEKIGNDARVVLPDHALALVRRRFQPGAQGRIFPVNPRSVSASFTRACDLLGIDDLHFHDLRHEAISRLFELGWTIPQAASVSGHRTWTSLKRYSHLHQDGDKYAGWPWLARLGLVQPA
ncbi:site-specific integrase [Malikia sp.]|uniref:site-specific integrase n=1 Tax=Malikia sp. TaxID=2070706 RepID=UPI002622B0C7|nr:site-specific integrase [Malikia sp.]MDD2728502.1 site-specific integrase [Malikia sp.]